MVSMRVSVCETLSRARRGASRAVARGERVHDFHAGRRQRRFTLSIGELSTGELRSSDVCREPRGVNALAASPGEVLTAAGRNRTRTVTHPLDR
jgi:hypothetical protein